MNEELSLKGADIEDQIAFLQDRVNAILGEMDVLKNRIARDIRNAQKYSLSEVALTMLPLRDALEKALVVETSDVDALREGIVLSLQLMRTIFSKNGITEISPLPGEQFDPRSHHALSKVEINRSPSYIVKLEKKGYEIEGRLLRRAMVVIASDDSANSA
jgi:molecular chaperone GrpE